MGCRNFPDMAGPPDISLEAVTAIIRYEAPESVRWPEDPEWVKLEYVYHEKKRFHQNFSFEVFKGFVEEEKVRGQFRFQVFTDPEGTVWAKSVSRKERRTNRR